MVDGYKGELQTVVNNEVLKNLLILAANANASEVVRGQALLKIDDLMDAFKADPNKFQTPSAADMPPGAPIGMPAMDFLNDNNTY